MNFRFLSQLVPAGILALVCAAWPAQAQTTVPVQNAGFGPTGGHITGVLDLNVFDPAPVAITQQLGSSHWYGLANATSVTTIGFRPGIEVDDTSSAGVGYITYALGASLGGLLGLELPEADLWQPLTGWSLAPNTTYTFSIQVDAGSLLNLSALSSRGFGLGMTVGSTATNMGTFVADTISNTSLLSLSLLGGTAQRLTMTYTTGASPALGDIGIAVFAGRGVQTLQVSLLDSYKMDNASMSYSTFGAVPEPGMPIIILSGMGVLFLTRHRRASDGGSPNRLKMKVAALITLTAVGASGTLRALEVEEIGISIPNARFETGQGEIAQNLDLDSRDESLEALARELGDTGWCAKSIPSCLNQGGHFFPGVAIYHDRPGTGVAVIRRQPRAIPENVNRFCQSEAWMWVRVEGVAIEPGCNYTLGVDVDAGSRLNAAALHAQGFGIGLATGSTSTEHGKLFVDSQRLPDLLDVSVLRGTNHRLSISFVTGPNVPSGDVSVVIFATKAPAILPAVAIKDYRLHNVSLMRRRNLLSWNDAIKPTPLEITGELQDPAPNRVVTSVLVSLASESIGLPAAPEPSSAAMALTGAVVFASQRPRSSRAVSPRNHPGKD